MDEQTEEHRCSVCGLPLAVGDWPCVTTIRPHGKSVQTTPFVAYFDFALGKQIDSLGDRHQAMKGTYDPHTGKVWGQLDYRDKMSKGDLSARDDRVREQKRIERRRGE